MATKVKALQMWCKKMAEGYRDVDVVNMTSSWKDGLAFCAIIHRFRPDLIDFDALSKENVFENNQLAFEVAESELSIPALLDAPDMVAIKVPDKLSVVTYVSQYYNYFHNKPQLGGPGVKKPSTLKRHQDGDLSGPDAKRLTLTNKDTPVKDRQVSMGDKCMICHNKVYLLERHVDNGQLYHRTCFRSSELSPNKNLFKQPETKSPPSNEISNQTETKKSEPDFWKRRAQAKKVESESKVKVESDKSKERLHEVKDVNSKVSDSSSKNDVPEWNKSKDSNWNLKKVSDDKDRKSAINDLNRNTTETNRYEKVEKFVPERKIPDILKGDKQPTPRPRSVLNIVKKQEREEEPMDTTSKSEPQERPKPVSREEPKKVETEQRDSKARQGLSPARNSDNQYTQSKDKRESNVKSFTKDPESPPPLPKSTPPSLSPQSSSSPPPLPKNQPPNVPSGGTSSSSSSSSSRVISSKSPERPKSSIPTVSTSKHDDKSSKDSKHSSHFKFNLFGKKESQTNPEKDVTLNDSSKFPKKLSPDESKKSSKEKVDSSKSSKEKLDSSKTSKQKVDSLKENLPSPLSPKEKVESPKLRPVSVDSRTPKKMEIDDAITLTRQSKEPVAVLMSPTETDKELLGGLLQNLANVRQKKQDDVSKDASKGKSTGHLSMDLDRESNKKKVKSWSGEEKVNRKDKTKSDFVTSKLTVFGDANKSDKSKPPKLETHEKTKKEVKVKKDLFVDDDDIPEWKRALEKRKEAKRPYSVDILSQPSNKPTEMEKVGKSKPDRPNRPKSADLLADKKDQKPAWQIEAEKRMEARKGGYVDPEKAKVDHDVKGITKDTEKDKYDKDSKKNSQNLLLKDNDNRYNGRRTDTEDINVTKREPRKLPVPPSVSENDNQEQKKKKISVGQKFDFIHNDEGTSKVTGKPPRPPPPSPGGPKSRDSFSPFVAGKIASFTNPQTTPGSGRTGDESKTFGEVKRLSPIEIQQQLKDIDSRLTNLEVRGRHLEDTIRKAQDEEEDEKLMIEWFRLVNEKNELVRKEADLIYVSRAQELEDQQMEINRKIRLLMCKPEHLRTDADKEEEEYLIDKLVDIVNQRSVIVDSQDEDRIRYEEEDKDIAQILESKGFCRVSPKSSLAKDEKILEKKKKKKKKQKKGKLL